MEAAGKAFKLRTYRAIGVRYDDIPEGTVWDLEGSHVFLVREIPDGREYVVGVNMIPTDDGGAICSEYRRIVVLWQ